MYAYSDLLNQLIKLTNQLFQLQATRYKHLVDSSSRGIHCPYAIATHKYAVAEENELRIKLTEIRLLLEKIDAVQIPTLGVWVDIDT